MKRPLVIAPNYRVYLQLHMRQPNRKPHAVHGQAILEFLIIGVVALLGLLAARGPISQKLQGLFGDAGQHEREATDTLTGLQLEGMPLAGGHEQRTPEDEEKDKDKKEGGPIVIASGGPAAPRPSPPIGTGGLGGSGGGGGGGGGGGAGPSGPQTPPTTPTIPNIPPIVGGGGPAPPPQIVVIGDIVATAPNATEQSLINAARALLFSTPITFTLFDFNTSSLVTRSVAQVVNNVALFGVPILVADLANTIGALAAVFFGHNPDNSFDRSRPVYLVFDQQVLASFTKEMVASVLAHESWHVNQLFNGIMNDFLNYPRVVDIEYEAFVAGAAAWNAVKGTQTEPSLDAGAGCVAAGEARCKEILAADFGYPTGPRQG